MKIAFIIALRNLLRHRGKSLIVGVILFLGALIMTLGNAVVSGMNRGLEENIVERFTGHIVVISTEQENPNILFIPMGKDVALIRDFSKVKTVLDKEKYIQQYLPAARGFSLVLAEDGDIDLAMLLGVDFPKYNAMFHNNVQILEGKLLSEGERGMLVSSDRRERYFNDQNIWLKPMGFPLDEKNFTDEARKYRDKMIIKEGIVLMGASNDSTAFDVYVPIRGIHRYAFLDDVWKFFNIVDIDTFREAFQWVTNADAEVKLNKETTALLNDNQNLDDLFKEETLVDASQVKNKIQTSLKNLKAKKSIPLKKTDTGAYNVVFVKLKHGDDIPTRIASLNAALTNAGAPARAVTWKDAIGQIGDMAGIIRGALMGFVFLIFFVAVIIIMNTLSMAALERTAELGMMRAVGAPKSFVTQMFFFETLALAFLFGGLGIGIGIAGVPILNALHITTEHTILQLLFGGKTFAPYLSLSDIFTGVFELGMVTLVASLYPIFLARRMTPLDAVSRDT
ncbi:MAG TPA: FtsX-like permease family protein [Turneriella sp.]|nr:FtsX-like permease family protein [Turneriella sp.]